ncbi:MAG: peptidoglycan editing factor PgeF [Mariprofundaceae bacterium]
MFLRSNRFAQHGITAAFTLRQAGINPAPCDTRKPNRHANGCDTHINKNTLSVMKALNISGMPHMANQSHGISAQHCQSDGESVTRSTADILFATEPSTPIAIRTADCLPILLADPVAGVIAAVHAGWRGTAANITQVAIHTMQQWGAHPEKILAVMGPSIGPCCFHIHHECAAMLTASCPDAEAAISNDQKHISADLAAINHLQLQQSGIKKQHIDHIKACTCCDSKRFFSFRRDGSRSGRQLAIITLDNCSS